ncbi:MAG: phenylacetic acid degradation protein PaaN [Flavobacteriaceae bacterium]|nr:phenylacetic acid degradation protein PaaN [Flavobacteriaceae bacterium]
MNYYDKHKDVLATAVAAIYQRKYWSPYPESPRAYAEDADAKAKEAFAKQMNQNFDGLTASTNWVGEEVSPFLQTGIGVKYPQHSVDELLANATKAQQSWGSTSVETRAGLLTESLERIKGRFFDIAYATMHCTGQANMMSFQASGPHANDRALEAVAMGLQQQTIFPAEVEWVKPMGKFDLKLRKNYKSVPKGVGLVIGCSTFPVWNTVPGVYANLICGNVTLVKPHPKAVLPIAIVIAELQKLLTEAGLDPNTVQLAVDTSDAPITKQLAENKAIKLVDFTGSNAFGDYVESLPKTTFTEKAGVNCALIDSVADMKAVAGNLAFSACLYSGQMCTAPQTIFIAETGVKTSEGHFSYDEVVVSISEAFTGLVNNPKMGANILGALQSDVTLNRLQNAKNLGGKVVLDTALVKNEEFENSRTHSPVLLEVSAADEQIYGQECFGPVTFIVKTSNIKQSLEIMQELAVSKGALTCSCWCTDADKCSEIETQMNAAFVPVSFNFGGAAFVNSHAAFSDLHVTGGNPAGNASFTNADFITKRFVWVGNRYGI